jgi:hypothetical protein
MARRSERGSTVAEAAITIGLFLLLIIGLLGMGVVFYDYQTISNAAREGARYGVIAVNTPTSAQVAARVCSMLSTGAAPSTCPTPTGNALPKCVLPPDSKTTGGTIPTADDVYVSTCSVKQANNLTISYTEVDIRKNIKLPLLPSIPMHTTAAMRNETN